MIKYPKGINSEDYYVYSYIYYRAKKLGYLKEALYYYRQRKGSICNTSNGNGTFWKIIVANMVKENLEKLNCTNNKGIENFNMQAYSDTLNDLIRAGTSKKLIKEYTGKLRKFFWKVLFDGNKSVSGKIKVLLFMIAPCKYTRLKNKLLKNKLVQYELFS